MHDHDHDDAPDQGLAEREQERLAELEGRFVRALRDKDAGRLDAAEETLREILKVEPRLPEPHLELARILLDTDRLSEAEPHAREAIRWLAQGGQWTEDLPEDVVKGLAHGLLAEVLRRRADDDDVIFGDPAAFKALVEEARSHYAKAAELDPSDEYASWHALFLGPPKGRDAPVIPKPVEDDDT